MTKSYLKVNSLSKDHVNLIKGVGIFLIVLHNIWHLMDPTIGQNEFTFESILIERYIDYFLIHPQEFIVLLFSFWGHFGVQLFIFVSVYGISISLTKTPRNHLTFLYQRFSKLYISFLVCILFYIALNVAYHGFNYLTNPEFPWISLLWKVTLISNFIPGEALPPVGPWWFVPFIFQMYLILPWLLQIFHKFGGLSLLIIAIAGYLLEVFYSSDFPNLNYNPLGHLPLICLAIFLSFKKEIHVPQWVFLVVVSVFAASQFNFYFWLVGDVSITIIGLLAISRFLFDAKPKALMIKFFGFLGAISLHLFLVNGFVRIPFMKLFTVLNAWWWDLFIGILVLLTSVFFALLLRWMDNGCRKLLKAGIEAMR